jgi:hypothetical protein
MVENAMGLIARSGALRPATSRRSLAGLANSRFTQRAAFSSQPPRLLPSADSLFSRSSGSSEPTSYFQRSSLPANTIVKFVPQQTAWIVERMGKFSRILQPGLAVLVPLIDRIAYVKSLKEAAIETTLLSSWTVSSTLASSIPTKPATVLKMPSTPFHNLPKLPCAQRLVNSLLIMS